MEKRLVTRWEVSVWVQNFAVQLFGSMKTRTRITCNISQVKILTRACHVVWYKNAVTFDTTLVCHILLNTSVAETATFRDSWFFNGSVCLGALCSISANGSKYAEYTCAFLQEVFNLSALPQCWEMIENAKFMWCVSQSKLSTTCNIDPHQQPGCFTSPLNTIFILLNQLGSKKTAH